MGVTDLLLADAPKSGRTIAARHLLPLRVTDLIRNARLDGTALTDVVKRTARREKIKRSITVHRLFRGGVFSSHESVCKLSHFDSRYSGCLTAALPGPALGETSDE
jgi:hypothetical protein